MVALAAHDESRQLRFGHILRLEWALGLMSWLERNEVPVREVGLSFDGPDCADYYSVICPSLV